MKKTRQEQASEQKTVVENDLAIIVFETSDAAWVNEQIAQRLSKIRSDVSLFLVSDKEADLVSGKDIAEMQSKGKCRILSWDAWKETMEQERHKWLFVADHDNAHMLQQAVSFFSTAKKSFSEVGVYTGVITKQSGKQKRSFSKRLQHGWFNFIAQLITPTEQHDHTLNFQYFHKQVLKETASHQNNNAGKNLIGASYLGYPLIPVSLTLKEVNTRSISWRKVFSNAWSGRWSWFVSEPLIRRKTASALWRPAFFFFSLFALASMLLLSQQFGMTWDEKRHNDYSKESLKYFETFGEDTTCLSETLPTQEFRYYGEHFNVIAAFLYTHILPLGEYETRHLLNALYGFLAMLFAALLAKDMGSWRAGTLALLLIFLSPVFFGHSMNNPTDIPFAAGFAIALYYLCKIYRTFPVPKFSHIFMASVGIGIAVGSRVGGILLYAYAGLFLGVHFLMHFRKHGFKHMISYVKVLVLLGVIGHVISISLWPFGQQHIFTNWYVALKKSTEGAYFTYNHELFEGVRMYMANVPWYYLPKFIVINAPLVVLAGLAFSALWLFYKKRRADRILWIFMLFALVFPIAYAEYQSMYYYNGWRHYLFIYPSLIVLAAAGWEALMRIVNSRIFSMVAMAIFAALCILPASWMMRNTPNEYVYFNELVGGIKGAYGEYETDYYSNSCRAAGEWIAMQEPGKKLLVAINNEPQTAAYYATQLNPALEFKWVREYEEQKPFWDYAILTSRTYSKKEMEEGSYPPKGTVHVIEADGVPLAAIVKRESYSMPLGYKAMEAKNVDSAIYYFADAVRLNPKDEEAWRMLGSAYTTKGYADSALQMLNKSIEIFPENYTAYNDIGQVYMGLKRDNVKALEYFKKATDLKFNYTDAYYYSAACYLGQNDFSGAIPFLEKAIKRGGSGIPEIYYNLGICYMNTGNMKKSEENLILSVSLNPNFAMGYRALAEVFQKQGRQNEAQQCMDRFNQLGGGAMQ